MPTIEERALALVNEVRKERGLTPWYEGRGSREDSSLLEAFCRTLETLDATLAEFEAFKREVSDAVEDYYGEYRKDLMHPLLRRFILPKPVDPLVEAVREAMDADNETTVQFTNDLRASLAKRGLKLVEVGDAD